jgi:hypothetical protein
MTKETGRSLRKIGLIVETVCLLGLVSISRQKVDPADAAKLAQIRMFWMVLAAGIAAGFVTWAVGTAAIYWPRRPRGQDSA